jgi:predicted alpha/beta hydrolase family esterase
MKTAIILHGMPSREEYYNPESPAQSNKHWIPWIQRQLLLKDILAQAPELPEPYAPDYEKWRAVFEQFKVDQETMLVGHSCGAGFLVRWLSENNIKVGKVALVAPFLDPDHDEVPGDFFKFEIDANLVSKTAGLGIIYSTDDDQEILTSVNQLRTLLPSAKILELTNKGHFTYRTMQTEQFPESLNWLVS